ncbi:hypothetical protein AMTRI_Chr01g133070 [Amborella trichopoda]|uniref:Uncharacterized protein n=1 Tax=Amborella trichopoda TaxID=13333 RepID=W1PZU1_AMBTC|nr:GDSL esterase/lipase At5g45920 [Amborella trichopoda]ERN13963.1 hypothetical protein AMTR_s00021p00148410 [Amborella trichopoda]|eukprot:XP_006852496.1 GDSL esterase/lipase At5g45920 [Amborella trichopoda]
MRPKIVLFGDSITEASFDVGGWGAALANCFCRTADVVLRGYSGYNTRWVLKVLDRVFPLKSQTQSLSLASPSNVVAVTLFLGANDASLPDRSSAFQHVPIAEYHQNLLAIIAHFKALWPCTVILLITPPPIDEDGRLRYPYGENPSGLPERTLESAKAYATACLEVGREACVPVIDLCSKMQSTPGWEKLYLSDGLHLTAEGNRVVFEEVVEALQKEGVSPEKRTVDLPLLSEMDPNDPLKSFQLLP